MTIVWTILLLSLAPLALGAWLLRTRPNTPVPAGRTVAASALLCALAFNLVFFWQELWLVLPKALVPGLHPILYHNDHDWRGDAPIAELLQGSGAIAALAAGMCALLALRIARRASATGRLFLFWIAFEGLYQALSQLLIGSLLPGNDVGRALHYLGIGAAPKAALTLVALALMVGAGGLLARAYPFPVRGRAFVSAIAVPALACVGLVIPFRLPRPIVEVALIPLLVNLAGIGWVVVGAAWTRPVAAEAPGQAPTIAGPLLALAVTLLLFQLVLRPGIAF
jgi:hypothetical protein